MRGSNTGELVFNDVAVPRENILEQENAGVGDNGYINDANAWGIIPWEIFSHALGIDYNINPSVAPMM